jgi:hypothetical protein
MGYGSIPENDTSGGVSVFERAGDVTPGSFSGSNTPLSTFENIAYQISHTPLSTFKSIAYQISHTELRAIATAHLAQYQISIQNIQIQAMVINYTFFIEYYI